MVVLPTTEIIEPESVPLFQVEYGLSLILTRCLVSNGFKPLLLYSFVTNMSITTG